MILRQRLNLFYSNYILNKKKSRAKQHPKKRPEIINNFYLLILTLSLSYTRMYVPYIKGIRARLLFNQISIRKLATPNHTLQTSLTNTYTNNKIRLIFPAELTQPQIVTFV